MTLAHALTLKPSTRIILGHLEKRGYITPLIALNSYALHLSSRIAELKAAGYRINTEIRTDGAGHRYARHTLITAVH